MEIKARVTRQKATWDKDHCALCTSQACKNHQHFLGVDAPQPYKQCFTCWYKLEVAEVPFKCAFLLGVLIPVLSLPSLLIAKDSSWTLTVLVRSLGRLCHTKPISLNNHLKLLPQKNTHRLVPSLPALLSRPAPHLWKTWLLLHKFLHL